MKIRCIEPEDRDEWLRMRVALWPDYSLEEHLSEMDEFSVGKQPLAVFVANRSEGGLGGFLEVSIRPYADGCETQSVGYLVMT